MAYPRHNVTIFLEIASLCMALICGCVLGWAMFGPETNYLVLTISGALFTAFLLITIALILDPDRIRANQSMSVLNLASATLEAMQEGFTSEAAQKVCEILLPSTSACAVAITDREVVLGYAGAGREELGELGGHIRTAGTKRTVQDGKTRVLRSQLEVGLPVPMSAIQAAIIVPLKMGSSIQGTLKFYYPKPSRISETQISVAEGFGQLLSTQIAALQLEEQKKLATSMELKALQSQINPHFLFNTINTIASFTRTDPARARTLLREFAKFYRSTLEDSGDLIEFRRELEQTQRYFMFELARFGEDRLELICNVEPEVEDMMVPPFLIQPLVENAVRHAMPSEGKLTIRVEGVRQGDDVIISVIDDGNGMTQEACNNILHPGSTTGCGIAVGNVHDRICGYFGAGTHLEVESELGQGTTVRLVLVEGALRQY